MTLLERMMDKIEAGWVDEVLDFWFGELTYQDWFDGDEKLDEKIRTRFQPLYQQLRDEFDEKAVTDACTALAAIIVLDQFPRNIFRRTAMAFATDDIAVGLSRRAVDHGWDHEVEPERRSFFYMPFMHSEILADQERCVDLFRGLGEGSGLDYAIEHCDIIAKFGRFPHRNHILGRQSTAEELEFLKGHSGYGQ